VAPTTTVTATAVAWGGNCMKQCKNQIGKSWHLTESFFINLCSIAHRAVLMMC
jgi:hypothetical protein